MKESQREIQSRMAILPALSSWGDDLFMSTNNQESLDREGNPRGDLTSWGIGNRNISENGQRGIRTSYASSGRSRSTWKSTTSQIRSPFLIALTDTDELPGRIRAILAAVRRQPRSPTCSRWSIMGSRSPESRRSPKTPRRLDRRRRAASSSLGLVPCHEVTPPFFRCRSL